MIPWYATTISKYSITKMKFSCGKMSSILGIYTEIQLSKTKAMLYGYGNTIHIIHT